jgi:hypothetical protein
MCRFLADFLIGAHNRRSLARDRDCQLEGPRNGLEKPIRWASCYLSP